MWVYSYLSTKFELDRPTKNGDLLSDRNPWTGRHTNTHTHTHTHRLNLILFPYRVK